jgi:hypothetical protein
VAEAVHTGLTDGTVTEIVDGDIKEGDTVVVEASGSDGATPSPGSSSLRRLF